jgi:hypothetical protein
MAMIACEGSVLCKITVDNGLVGKTLVLLMACYYVFDVMYPKKHEAILQLLQDVLMEVTEDKGSMYKVASYRPLIAELMGKLK